MILILKIIIFYNVILISVVVIIKVSTFVWTSLMDYSILGVWQSLVPICFQCIWKRAAWRVYKISPFVFCCRQKVTQVWIDIGVSKIWHWAFKFSQRIIVFHKWVQNDCFGLCWCHSVSPLIRRTRLIPAQISVKAFTGPYFGCV